MKDDNKIKGLIFGQAIGDALGLSTEFLSKKEVNIIYKERITYDNILQDDYRKTWKKGEWTDDTDMFLILFKHLLNSENFLVDELILAKDFHNWYNKGFEIQDNVYKIAKGVGINIGRVLKDETFLSNPKLSSFKISLHSKSNGSVMRSGILSIFPNAIFNTIESCKITHFSDDCIVSCLFLVLFIKKLQQPIKKDLQQIIENVLDEIELLKYDVDILRKIINIQNLSDLDLNNNIGYTYKPIGCAIYALKNLKNKSFYDALEEIIREGGDGDTNGCVTGCVLGCYMGFDNIDKLLIEKLENKNYLFNIFYSYKMKIPEDEIDEHFNFIINNNMQDLVYQYTVSSNNMRQTNEIEKLNELILNAPKLSKQYTVYNMKSSNDKILYIDVNNRQTSFINANELKKGDIFSQQSRYNYDVISTTYDKNYPLSPFSKDLITDLVTDDIDMYTFAEIEKFTKSSKEIRDVYYKLSRYIKMYEEKMSDSREDITVDEIEKNNTDIYNQNELIEIKKLIRELKEVIKHRYYIDLCCCCLFKIKLTNKTGLLIENCSQYQDQREILIPDPTFFIVKKISREKYKIINPFDYYDRMETFIINGVEYSKYNNLPEFKGNVVTKMLTVYEVEVIDISKYRDENKSWFASYKNIPSFSRPHSEPIINHRKKSLEDLYSYMSSRKSRRSSSRRRRRSNSL